MLTSRAYEMHDILMLVNLCPCCKMYQTNLTQLMTGNKPKNDPRSWDVVLGVDVLRTPCSAYYSNRSESIFSSRGLLVYFLVALASMTAHIGLQLFWQFKFQLRVRVIYNVGVTSKPRSQPHVHADDNHKSLILCPHSRWSNACIKLRSRIPLLLRLLPFMSAIQMHRSDI